VESLLLKYPLNYTGADLFGTVGQIAGPVAAATAIIIPLPSSFFRLNHCPIHSINCVLLPQETLPTVNPLENFSIGTLPDPNDDEDLLLPIVSDRDY
jgi:hypothetical protein